MVELFAVSSEDEAESFAASEAEALSAVAAGAVAEDDAPVEGADAVWSEAAVWAVPVTKGSVLVPMPLPAVAKLMTTAQRTTATRADITATISTLRCDVRLRFR